MEMEDVVKQVAELKEKKARHESEIEDIKTNIIASKDLFYQKHENYNKVVKKYAELNEMFSNVSETSVNKLNEQLMNIIMKVFDKIISKKVDLEMQIGDKHDRNIKLGLNNKGIGQLEEVWGYRNYYSNPTTDNKEKVPTRTHIIRELETYINILQDKAIVDKMIEVIHKPEKKKMLETLHKYLIDWKNTPITKSDIFISREIYCQKRTSDLYRDGEVWNIDIKKIGFKGIKFRINETKEWTSDKYLKRTSLCINMVDGNGQEYTIYDITPPSKYDGYDLEDARYVSCQVWDILEGYIDEIMQNVKVEQKEKMNTLQLIWNEVSPYLMVDAI